VQHLTNIDLNKPHQNNARGARRAVSGFTIVELLIVIVVIAVLAAITIVAFNGVKDRAISASLKSDLNAASKAMELAKVDGADSYPSSLPASVKVSSGNVLQMTAVTDSSKQYCLNAYGANNKVASISSTAGVQDALCPGVTVGVAVGGTAPTTPRGTNLLAGFVNWTVSGGMSYNSSTGELICDNVSSGAAVSPLIRVDGPTQGNFQYQAIATVSSPTRAYSGSYGASEYFASDGATPVYNTAASPGPYSGNGNAPALAAPLSSWQSVNFNMIMGPNIVYVRLYVRCDRAATYYTSDTHYRNPTYVIQ